jgi:glycosyltransferase involved in cell wall biosynthesis
MNIGFDAKRFFKNFTGLGNYSRFVVDALSVYHPANQYILFTPRQRKHPEIDKLIQRENIEVVSPKGLYSKSFLASLWRTFGIRNNAALNNVQIFHGLSHELPVGLPKKIKQVLTVHDLIFLRYPEFFNPIDVRIYKTKVAYAAKRADCIVAVSQQSANDVQEFLNVEKSKIKVVYQGVHPIFKVNKSSSEVEAVKQKYSLSSEYILNVGTIEERKNLKVLVKALGIIPERERISVVVLGRKTSYYTAVVDEIKRTGLARFFTFIDNASFQDFPAIYQGASLFVYPSLFEGFGIPLVEAIESGIPVVTSQTSSLPEAAGPASAYIDPHNAEGLATTIRKILNDSVLRGSMVSESKKYIAKFQPEVIANELMKVYQSIL